MTSKRITANQREGLSVADSITGNQFYVGGNSSDKSVNVNITSGGGSGGTSSTFGATFPTIGTAIGAIDSTGKMAGLNLDASGNLKISGTLSVGGTVDEAAFTAGTSTFTGVGGVFNDSVASLTSGQQGAVRLTATRAQHINLRNNTGTEMGTAANPLQVSLANAPTVAVSGTVTANIGTTNGLALDASVTGLQVAQGSTTSGQKGGLAFGAVTTAAPAYTTAQSSPLSIDTAGNLRVAGTFSASPPSSLVSTANSTTTNLAGGATFTGTSEDVSNYAALQISAFSSHASATDGLSLQQSSDGTNWDLTDVYTIAATTGKVFSIQPSAKFYRLVYTNGATLTTSLRIQSVYHYAAPNPSSQRSSDAYTNETDLTQNWTFNSLYNGTTWDRMRGDITNGLDVDVTRLPALVAGSAVIGKVSIDQTTPGTTNLVALAANQSVNVAQINGVTPLMGNGVTGTGSQRVTIASDNTAFSVNANQGTAAALGAGWVTINGEQADTTGTFTNATQTTSVTATNLAGYGNVLISINGTFGTATAVFEGSDDGGTTWYTIGEAARTDSNIVESGYTSLTNTTRAWQTNNPGWDSLRVRSTAVASGTVNVRISPSAAPSAAGATVQLGSAIPTGTNTIGSVKLTNGTNTMTIGTGTYGQPGLVIAPHDTQAMTDAFSNSATKDVDENFNQLSYITQGLVYNGTTWDRMRSGGVTGTQSVAGATASGSSLAANPVTGGGLAKTANPTAVTDGQVVNSTHDKLGKQVVVGSIRDLKVNQITTITSSTAETTVLTAVASTFLDVYGVIVVNSSATATNVAFKDSTAGTTRFNLYIPAGDTRGFMLNESGGFAQTTINNNWTATSTTSVASLVITFLAVKNT